MEDISEDEESASIYNESRNFDDIKFATYRTSAKLFYIQRYTNLNLVDIYNIIEAFRENGMNTGNHNAEIDETRLECVIASIFFALHKRLPSTNDIDVESNIVSLTKWLMHTYDRENLGRIRILSVKVALTALCSGRLVDKLRYVFTQISDPNGLLESSKFDEYLKEVLALPAAVGEEPSFTYNNDTWKEFFKPVGVLETKNTRMDQFLKSLMIEKTSGVLLWLHMLDKLTKTSAIQHDVKCKACGRKPFSGLRYKCLDCFNYQLCQDCFWRDKLSGSHLNSHDVREHNSWNKDEMGISVRKKLFCSVSKHPSKLPFYPKEPEPINTLDMSNIVPGLPGNPSFISSNDEVVVNQQDSFGADDSSVFKYPKNAELSRESVARMDDEHKLISRYAERLASDKESESAGSDVIDFSFGGDISKEQHVIITSLEDQNRSLLREIRKLKVEHDQTVKSAQQAASDPNVMTELKILRQRKDELEMRMSALQETRRELMVQLEGLMKLLKDNACDVSYKEKQLANYKCLRGPVIVFLEWRDRDSQGACKVLSVLPKNISLFSFYVFVVAGRGCRDEVEVVRFFLDWESGSWNLGAFNEEEGQENLTLTGPIEGNKDRGRPQIKYLTSFSTWSAERVPEGPEFERGRNTGENKSNEADNQGLSPSYQKLTLNRDNVSPSKVSKLQSAVNGHATQGSLTGVNGDVKQAFGKASIDGKERNLRFDLFRSVDDITSVISVLVGQLTQEDSKVTMDAINAALPGQTANRKYDHLTRDLDIIMNELSATQVSQDLMDVRNPVPSYLLT
eukprot:gene16500-18140_t